MALVLDPRTGQYVEVPDSSAAARLPPAPNPLNVPITPEQAFAQGRTVTPPAGVDPDVPILPGQTWPLQPLQLSPGVVPDSAVNATPARTAADLAGTNQAIAGALRTARPDAGILQPAQRGNYNMYNTAPGALPQPVGGGLNFGFGVNGSPTAQQYLQRMETIDQQRRADATQRTLMREVLGAQSQITANSTIGEIGAARTRLAALTPLLGGQLEAQGRLGAARIGADAAGQDAQLRLQGAQLGAQADLAGRLLAADLTGQYGVRAAEAKAAGTLATAQQKANSGESRLASANAALAESRLAAIRAGVESGQLDPVTGVISATRTGQEPRPQVFIDPITGIPYTQDEIDFQQQQRLAAARQRQANQ